jgi:hypothetical protein
MDKLVKCKNKNCQNDLVHIEGRRPKEFCSPKCRTDFHNSKKVKGVGRGRPKGAKNKFKPSAIDLVEAENRDNPLTNAARGRDKGGVNKGEVKKEKKPVGIKNWKREKTLLGGLHKKLAINEMPKGLSLMQQLEWREQNQ